MIDQNKADFHFEAARGLLSRQTEPRRRQRAIVDGDSMWPFLRDGYTIEYSEIHVSSYEPGDMLVLRRNDRRVVVHRLIGRVGHWFIEAGDNALSASLVAPENIMGRVEQAFDHHQNKVALAGATANWQKKRFAVFVFLATFFLFMHQFKNRLIGGRKSRLLWQMSVIYRGCLKVFGLDVPNIPPR